MNYLLILHISFGISLVVTFVIRYAAVLTKRTVPKTGRSFIKILGIGLLASGSALVIVDKAPITSACTSGLAIIFTIVALESALSVMQRRLSSDKVL